MKREPFTRWGHYSPDGKLIREIPTNPDGTMNEPYSVKAGEIIALIVEDPELCGEHRIMDRDGELRSYVMPHAPTAPGNRCTPITREQVARAFDVDPAWLGPEPNRWAAFTDDELADYLDIELRAGNEGFGSYATEAMAEQVKTEIERRKAL